MCGGEENRGYAPGMMLPSVGRFHSDRRSGFTFGSVIVTLQRDCNCFKTGNSIRFGGEEDCSLCAGTSIGFGGYSRRSKRKRVTVAYRCVDLDPLQRRDERK